MGHSVKQVQPSALTSRHAMASVVVVVVLVGMVMVMVVVVPHKVLLCTSVHTL